MPLLAGWVWKLVELQMSIMIYSRNNKSPQGWICPCAKMGICPSLEIKTKNQNFLENLTSGAQFRIIDLILTMTVYLLVWYSHYTRARFTVRVCCSGELAVHSCPLLCLQGKVAKLANELFYCSSLLSWQQIF